MKTKYKHRYRLLKLKNGKFNLQTRRFFIWCYITLDGVNEIFDKRGEANIRIKELEYKPEKIKVY